LSKENPGNIALKQRDYRSCGMRPSVSAVIIHHNNRDLLKKCLASLKRQTHAPSEILLVDNGSTDGSALSVSAEFPEARLLRNDCNLAFSRACNKAIGMAAGEFILLLNNDVVLDEGYIGSLLECMSADGGVGIAGGKILSADRRRIDSAGQSLARSRKVIDRGYGQPDNRQYDKPMHVFGIGASAACYRRSMLDEITDEGKYFDEGFEFFYEDMDLSCRAQRKGWKAYYQPKATAAHVRGATSKTHEPRFSFLKKYYIAHLSTRLQRCAIKSRYLLISKHDSAGDIARNLPFLLWYEIRQAAYILLFNPAIIFTKKAKAGADH